MLLKERIFWPIHFWKTKYSHKNRYWDYRLRELSFCLRDFLWQQKMYSPEPLLFSAAWSPNSPPAPARLSRDPQLSVLQLPSGQSRNHPIRQGQTYSRSCRVLCQGIPTFLLLCLTPAPDLQWEEIDLTADSVFSLTNTWLQPYQ